MVFSSVPSTFLQFCDSLTSVANKLRGKEVVIMAENLNGHVRSSADDYVDHHGSSGFGNRKKEGERNLELCTAIKKTVEGINKAMENTIPKKRKVTE